MNLEAHAKNELEIAGLFAKDSDYNGMLGEDMMELIKVFAKQGHSGFSAGMISDLFNKLSRYLPLTPLTGDDSEWNSTNRDVLQNKRCSRIFKKNEQAYDIRAVVFREPNGTCFTSHESRHDITFPYIPKTEYVDVHAEHMDRESQP